MDGTLDAHSMKSMYMSLWVQQYPPGPVHRRIQFILLDLQFDDKCVEENKQWKTNRN